MSESKRRRIEIDAVPLTAATSDGGGAAANVGSGINVSSSSSGGGGASSASGHSKVVPERVSWVLHTEEPDEIEAGAPSDTLAALLLLLSELPK